MDFRIATTEDIDLVYDFLQKALEEEGYDKYFTHTKEELKKLIFQDKQGQVLLAIKNNTPIGLALFSINREFKIFKKPSICLHEIYVIPDYREHGVAAKMRDELFSIIKKELHLS